MPDTTAGTVWMRRWVERSVGLRDAFLVFVVGCALLEVGARAGLYPPYVLPAPSAIALRLVETAGLMWGHMLTTLVEIVGGFFLAVVVGVLLAAAIVFIPFVERGFYPWLVVLQVIPKVALGPLLIIWLGFGYLPKILIAFLVAFFPIMIDTMVGMKSVERDAVFLMRSMGASQRSTFFLLRLPHALPHVFGSLKVAVTLATVGAIVGEFIGADEGLGYVLIFANGSMDTTLMFAALIWISAVALVLYMVVGAIERACLSWHVSQRSGAGAA
ncbi:MAG: ABC transporter permease [Burkholderiales bacterium]|nr:ABC transporter permease [Burkholderiales bacterium]